MTENEQMMPENEARCPCGSGRPYDTCCGSRHRGILHLGTAAPSPEALMRSRYSASVLGLRDYLLRTWHPSTRPPGLDLAEAPEWTSLQILSTTAREDNGQVHFRAIYRAANGWGYLEEVSDFVREAGEWFYLAGRTREGVFKPGRNDKCPCGSGRKYKSCCL